jgi:BirA family biotin operon repressor/biotin-[acetyl-CoA-carboxylase] ligase
MIKTRIEIPVIWMKEVDSTNNEAVRHLNDAADGAVWVAEFQTAGKGQQENTWESEPGKNLLFSMLIRPENFRADNQFLISQAVALGICDYLHSEELPALIKWPNDIYIGNKKIVGILLEHHIRGDYIHTSIAGVGINVNQKEFKEAPNATSMYLETGSVYPLENVLHAVIQRIYERLAMAPGQLREAYLNRLYRYGVWAEYAAGNRRFKAKIVDIQPTGELMLEDETGAITAYLQKTVHFVC